MFPIAFAAVIGRLTYEIARWKLEKGATVGVLEQLLGSRTFGGTLLTQFSIGFNPLGCALFFLWAFSPLGAQSILRLLALDIDKTTHTTDIIYQDTESTQGLTRISLRPIGEDAAQRQAVWKYLGNRLGTLLLAPEGAQESKMDLWGNVKIPFLESAQDDGSWQETTSDLERESFTSLAGIPLTAIPIGNSSFALESSYLDLDCKNITTKEANDLLDPYPPQFRGDLTNITWPDGNHDVYYFKDHEFKNGTWHGVSMFSKGKGASGPSLWSIAVDRFVDNYWRNGSKHAEHAGLHSPALFRSESGITMESTRLLLQAEYARRFPIGHESVRTIVTCNVRQAYVESRIECQRQDGTPATCSVVQQRRSQRAHAPETISHFSFPEAFWSFTKDLPAATYTGHSGNYDIFNAYLRDPTAIGPNPFKGGYEQDDPSAEWPTKDLKTISRRFSQVLNTWMVLGSFSQQAGFSGGDIGIEPNLTTTAEVASQVQRYRVSKLWIALGILSCITFLIGGVASVVFASLADGPEVLGYVSTVMRDSKRLDLDPVVSSMRGIDISKLYKGLRLRFGYDETLSGLPVLGVGREAEMTPISKQAK